MSLKKLRILKKIVTQEKKEKMSPKMINNPTKFSFLTGYVNKNKDLF